MNKSVICLTFFFLAYLLFIVFPKRRTFTALGASLSLIAFNVIPFKHAFWVINWNVIGIFLGTAMVANVFIESRVPAFLAEIIVDNAKNTKWAILSICILTGFLSAFVENISTVLIIAPIALCLAKKINLNPMKMLIAIAISSNLQGTATLIGDPPSMLLAGFAKMNFMDFFIYQGKPGIFFAVEFGALAAFAVLFFIFRREKQKTQLIRIEKVVSWWPTIILFNLMFCLALSSLVDPDFSYLAGLLCITFGIISILWNKVSNNKNILGSLKLLDTNTAFFLAGIFVLVGSITLTGWVDKFAIFFSRNIGTNIFLGYTLFVFVAVLCSAVIDNIPFLAAMLPVAISVSHSLNMHPSLFLFGLLIGASLGGNITPIGASANIVACGILKKHGYEVRFGDFMKIGIPFTFAAVTLSYLFIWFVWK